MEVFDAGRDDDVTDLKNGKVIRFGEDFFDEIGTNSGAGDGGAEADELVFHVGDVEEAGFVGGNAAGLKKSGEDSGFAGKFLELGGVEVVEDYMDGENAFDDVDRAAGDCVNAGVIDG